MALEEEKFDVALVFLDRILEVEPENLEARFLKAEIFHRNLSDFSRAVAHYQKVIRLSRPADSIREKASRSLHELLQAAH